ncbi:MAG: T9SS type A sorting domain-containing protein [Bacteroidia bacterium]|nr:T9SS type A sorting domain-containing protein [Bacteroidia bacterium]
MKKYYLIIISFLPICVFAQTWVSVGGGVGSRVHDYAIYNNELYIGMQNFDGNYGLVSKWTGASWDTIGQIFVDGMINALEVVNNELYALNAAYNYQNGTCFCQIVNWNGSSWDTIGNTIGFTAVMIEYNNGLYIGGDFTSVNSVDANRIAKMNGTTWEPLGSGLNEEPKEFIVYNNELYVIGDFTQAGSVAVDFIASWDGSTWASVGGGLEPENPSYGLYQPDAEIFNGDLIISDGSLVSAGGVTLNSLIAKLDGNSWDNVGISGPQGYYNYYLAGFNDSLYCQKGLSRGQEILIWDNNNWSVMDVDYSIVDTIFLWEAFVFNNELYNIGEIYVNGFNLEGIIKLDFETGTNSENIYQKINIYPNPTKDYVQIITNNKNENNQYLLIDSYGRIKSKGEVIKEKYISLQHLKQGIYYLKIYSYNKNTVEIYKIVKM